MAYQVLEVRCLLALWEFIAKWRLEFLQLQQLWPLGGLAPLMKKHECHKSGLSEGR
jgi:hypothetical protein